MKKLILSAAFALACFTAQAKNEVIKNDDDKKSKNKAKVVKVETIPNDGGDSGCTMSGTYNCPNGDSVTVSFTGSNCIRQFIKVMKAVQAAAC